MITTEVLGLKMSASSQIGSRSLKELILNCDENTLISVFI